MTPSQPSLSERQVFDPEPCYRGIGRMTMDHNCVPVRRWFRTRWRCVGCGRWFKVDTR